MFIQNTSTHLNKWQYKHAEVIYQSAGRQTQLHTSHLHNSNSLYVNKVPLDFLCSPKPLHPSCSISPRVLCSLPAQTEMRVHTRTHAHFCTSYMSGSRTARKPKRVCAPPWNVHLMYSQRLRVNTHCLHNFRKILAARRRDEIPDTTLQISPVRHRTSVE